MTSSDLRPLPFIRLPQEPPTERLTRALNGTRRRSAGHESISSDQYFSRVGNYPSTRITFSPGRFHGPLPSERVGIERGGTTLRDMGGCGWGRSHVVPNPSFNCPLFECNVKIPRADPEISVASFFAPHKINFKRNPGRGHLPPAHRK